MEEIVVDSSSDGEVSDHPSDKEWEDLVETAQTKLPWGRMKKVAGAMAKTKARPPPSSGLELGRVVWVPVLQPTPKTRAAKQVIKPTKAPEKKSSSSNVFNFQF